MVGVCRCLSGGDDAKVTKNGKTRADTTKEAVASTPHRHRVDNPAIATIRGEAAAAAAGGRGGGGRGRRQQQHESDRPPAPAQQTLKKFAKWRRKLNSERRQLHRLRAAAPEPLEFAAHTTWPVNAARPAKRGVLVDILRSGLVPPTGPTTRRLGRASGSRRHACGGAPGGW